MSEWRSNTEGVWNWFDLDAEAYHAAPGVSNSMLGEFKRSPAHLQAYLKDKPEATPAQVIGSITHQLVLTPDAPVWWAVPPEGLSLRTKVGQEWKEQQQAKEIIDAKALKHVQESVAAVRSHPTASQALAVGRSEVSVFREFAYGGKVLRKARIDFVNAGDCLVDLKTTKDARPESFSKDVFNYGYHRQAAYYLDIWNDAAPEKDRKTAFVFIALEKDPPYAVSVFHVHPEAIKRGRGEFISLLAAYMDCVEKNHWPAYPEGVQTIDLPKWAYKTDRPWWADLAA